MRKTVAVCAMGALLLAGCDQLPWNQSQAPKSSSPATSTEPPKAKLDDPGVLALVNGKPITIDAFKNQVEAFPDLPESDKREFMTQYGKTRLINRRPHDAAERRILLEELAKEELAVQEAIAVGLDRSPEIERRLEQIRRAMLLEALAKRDTDAMTVTDEEVKTIYERMPQLSKVPERIRVRQIVVATLQEAEALRATAVNPGGADFAALARQHSIGAGKEQGGDIGWYVKAEDLPFVPETDAGSVKKFFPTLESVAFSLEKDQISQPVKGPDGNYYVIKLETRAPEQRKLLTELSDTIRNGLLIQKRQEAVQDHLERLWSKGTVQMNDRRLEQL